MIRSPRIVLAGSRFHSPSTWGSIQVLLFFGDRSRSPTSVLLFRSSSPLSPAPIARRSTDNYWAPPLPFSNFLHSTSDPLLIFWFSHTSFHFYPATVSVPPAAPPPPQVWPHLFPPTIFIAFSWFSDGCFWWLYSTAMNFLVFRSILISFIRVQRLFRFFLDYENHWERSYLFSTECFRIRAAST